MDAALGLGASASGADDPQRASSSSSASGWTQLLPPDVRAQLRAGKVPTGQRSGARPAATSQSVEELIAQGLQMAQGSNAPSSSQQRASAAGGHPDSRTPVRAAATAASGSAQALLDASADLGTLLQKLMSAEPEGGSDGLNLSELLSSSDLSSFPASLLSSLDRPGAWGGRPDTSGEAPALPCPCSALELILQHL